MTVFAFSSSERPAGTCDSARNPLTGPEYHVCSFERDPRRPPCGIHSAGESLAAVTVWILIIILIIVSLY